ncbi:hypothetical protein OQA88_12556 [Cercophora sp. LCS_1]
MADAGDGWQTVLPTKNSGIERLSRSQLEAYERQVLKEWEATRGHWSGIGKHTGTTPQDFAEAKKIHTRFKPAHDNRVLGSGTFGVVEKVNFFHNNKTVCVARKHIQYRRNVSIQALREEAHVMEKLDHEHIVRLVGTYCVRHNELYLLLWPIAVCNLDSLFNDLDLLKLGHGDRDDIIGRLLALDLQDLDAIEHGPAAAQTTSRQGNCPLDFLRRIVGCITRAVAYCHEAEIRHLDLKPSNILLNPGRVYLADFGISKDVHGRDHTMTIGPQGTPKWRAPEIHSRDEWSQQAADVYSLGLVFLNIATVLYGGNMADFDAVVADLTAQGRAEKLEQYYPKLEAMALATQQVVDANAPSFSPKHIVGLTSRMLSTDRSQRPRMKDVETELVELGGIDQIYHSSCCKKNSRFVTELLNNKLRKLIDEKNRLEAEKSRLQAEFEPLAKRLGVLERVGETYESRLRNEKAAQAKYNANLQQQLENERNERKRLEALLAAAQQRRPARPGIPLPASAERRLSAGSPAPCGLTMRTRRTHPLTTSSANGPTSSSQPQQKSTSPTVTFSSRPSYAAAMGTSASRVISPPSLRQSTLNVSVPDSPKPPSTSPSPDLAGYPLRSRTSGSRLPRAINPATPIRSNTPILYRDPSSTESTQHSMSSSTFSRLSSSRLYESAAETSVAGTPIIGSPEVNGAGHDRKPSNAHIFIPPSHVDGPDPEADQQHIAVGLGLGIMDRRESVTKDSSIRDTASIASSVAAPGTASPLPSGSVLSSPRGLYAVPDRQGGVKVPSLPTAKSWADVAARRQMKVG